ncbi:MAG: DUF222 domain-containing protein [Actinomycetota bacterium]|jgi:hypothetical protein
MTATALLSVDAGPEQDLTDLPVERLEAEIVGWNAQLSAATCRWLLLIGEFDRRRAWEAWECHNCAHYLDWICGIDRRTAREHVRVARALPDLPVTRAAFAAGDLSYAKVRAITRIATPDNEATLVDWARHSTASQLERMVRGYRSALRNDDLQDVNDRHADRYARWQWEDDGSLVISARLDPEAGAQFIAAVEAMMKAEQGGSAEPPATLQECPDARRADAFVALAESAMAAGMAEGLVRQVPEVVVHVDVSVLTDDDPSGCCQLDDGPALAPETARRLACDAKLVTIIEDADGNPLNVGRRHRRPPSALRRALAARDGCCQFPGCGSRRHLHAHHIRHWTRGGETVLGNVILLCSKHHRAVHEGGYICRASTNGAEIEFLRPDGSPIHLPSAAGSPLTRLPIPLADDAGTCLWGAGEKLDLHEAVDCLLDLREVS